MFEVSLFTPDAARKGRDKHGRPRKALNPYLSIGKLEIALDGDGWLISWGPIYRRGDWR